jgi:hypothetical protein
MATPDPPFEFVVSVSSDPGKGVPGVELTLAGHAPLRTDAAGRAKLAASGHQGDSVTVQIKCPAGFEEPGQPLAITLYRLSDRATPPVYDVRCVPTHRRVVAAIKAPKGIGVPIVHRGKVLTNVDSAGAAHVAIDAKPGEQVELTLDTTPEYAANLRPRSPTLTFVVPAHDDIVLLEQEFSIEAPPPKVVHVQKAAGRPRATKI